MKTMMITTDISHGCDWPKPKLSRVWSLEIPLDWTRSLLFKRELAKLTSDEQEEKGASFEETTQQVAMKIFLFLPKGKDCLRHLLIFATCLFSPASFGARHYYFYYFAFLCDEINLHENRREASFSGIWLVFLENQIQSGC